MERPKNAPHQGRPRRLGDEQLSVPECRHQLERALYGAQFQFEIRLTSLLAEDAGLNDDLAPLPEGTRQATAGLSSVQSPDLLRALHCELAKTCQEMQGISRSLTLLCQQPQKYFGSLEFWQTGLSASKLIQISVLTEPPKQPTPFCKEIAPKFCLATTYQKEIRVRFSLTVRKPSPRALNYRDVRVPPHYPISDENADHLPTRLRPKEFLLASRSPFHRPQPILWPFFVSPTDAPTSKYAIKGEWTAEIIVDGVNLGDVYSQSFRIKVQPYK